MPTPEASGPRAALLASLPDDLQRIVAPLLDEEPLPLDELERKAEEHLRHLERASQRLEFVDLELAEAVARNLAALLEYLAEAGRDHESHRCVHAAVRYFQLDDDLASDVDSLLGLDDDAQVVSAVARAVGRPDLAIELP